MTDNALPVSEMLEHIAGVAKDAQAGDRPFKCAAMIFVDHEGKWAGMVGGDTSVDLPSLLLIARDSLIRGDKSFTIFYRREPEAIVINGHDASNSAH